MSSVASDRQSRESTTVKQIRYDNTYITDANGHGKELVFAEHKVEAIISELLTQRLGNQQYDPITGTKTAKAVAEALRDRIQALGYARHKLIIQVALCQDTGQAMRVASRCLWDPANDGSACQYFHNGTLTCVCQVFGLYLE